MGRDGTIVVMATEVWVRNPSLCIKECVEERAFKYIWDYGHLVKYSLDPLKFVNVYCPPDVAWRQIVVDHQNASAAELRPGYSMENPYSEVGFWQYDEPLALLEEMLATPPKRGDHRVVVAGMPPASQGIVRTFYRHLRDLQIEYPDAIIHPHGIYSYRVLFGMGFRAADVDVRFGAKKGNVTLPNGKEVAYERAMELPEWVGLCNMPPHELKVPRNRCRFNIRAAEWAAVNFTNDLAFRVRGERYTSAAAASAGTLVMTKPRVFLKNKLEIQATDQFLCDTCSLQLKCRYFRTGSVCSVPDSEPAELARFFKTRDSDVIIDGLGTLLAAQTRRLERGLEDENISGKLSPEVTKIINTIFDRGVKLAKLVNPALAAAGAPKININSGNRTAITAATPQALMAAVVAELEARGIERSRITPEMVENLLGDTADLTNKAITVAAVERSA